MSEPRTEAEIKALIERNQEAYLEGWLQPDQFAWNVAALEAELLTARRETVATC